MGMEELPPAPEPGRYRVVAGDSRNGSCLERLGGAPDEHREIFRHACQAAGMRPSQIERPWERAEGDQASTG